MSGGAEVTAWLLTVLPRSTPHEGYLLKSSSVLKIMRSKVSEKEYLIAILNTGRKWGTGSLREPKYSLHTSLFQVAFNFLSTI